MKFAIERNLLKMAKRGLRKVGASAMGLSGEIEFNNETKEIMASNKLYSPLER